LSLGKSGGEPGNAPPGVADCAAMTPLRMPTNPSAAAVLARVVGPFEVVVLDPPRTGAREILSRLVELGPEVVAYCACDPVTLARDLKTLAGRGFVLEAVQAFDMFPQTHHFETLAWMSGPGKG